MKTFLGTILLYATLAAGKTYCQDPKAGFYEAIRSDDRAALARLVKEFGPSKKDARGTTPLMYAAALGSTESMKMLLDAGADPNAKNAFDITALMWCANKTDKTRLLLERGADVNAKSKQGPFPLLIAAASQGSVEILRMLIEKGADVQATGGSPAFTALTAATDANDLESVKLLLDHHASVAMPAGGAALMNAAAHGNVEMMRLLVSRGVPVNAQSPPVTNKVKNGDLALGSFTPLILAAAYGGPEAVTFLLDQKAEINAQDVRGMTPLMLAVALDHSDARVVKLLLSRGADAKVRSKADETALDWAHKFNDPAILALFDQRAVPVRAVSEFKTVVSAKEAIEKSIGLLDRTAASFFVEGGCSSCHAHNLTSMAMASARNVGFTPDLQRHKARSQETRTAWSSQDQTLMLRMDAPGGANMEAYGLLQFAADQVEPSITTDALVHNIAAQQSLTGNWHADGIARPPMADGDFTNTALAIRALSRFMIPARAQEFKQRIAKGAQWLRAAKPVTAEDRNMQLLGLKWAGVANGDLHERDLQQMVKQIRSHQRRDGGWTQTDYLASDAYATGQSLAALNEAGVPVTDETYRRGLRFLLATQLPDGSWHVVSRSPKFQPYFQSGFPHNHDQWISMSATAWATMAIADSLPAAKPTGTSLAALRSSNR